MDAGSRRYVRTRAEHRCEYCRIYQRLYPDFAFHIEHIVAKQHGGIDELDNLALSCHLCNSKKGPNLRAPLLGSPIVGTDYESWVWRLAVC